MEDYQKNITPHIHELDDISNLTLGIDIGGTQTRITLGGLHKNKITQLLNLEIQSSKLNSIIPPIQEILTITKKQYNREIHQACIAAAGIISPDHKKAELTNLPWNIHLPDIHQQTNLQNILLINDFQAIGYAINLINHTNPHEILYITPEYLQPTPQTPKAIIGAGTGLGKTYLTYQSTSQIYLPHPSEGGHADLPITTPEEHHLAQYITQKKHPNQGLTYEDILSGQGLTHIYTYLTEQKNIQNTITETIKHSTDPAAIISENRHNDDTCKQTLNLFSKFYARCAKNYALDTLPTGGLYIAGGIAQKNQDILFNDDFLEEFTNAYQRQPLLKNIPIYLITDTEISLRGALFAAIHSFS